MRKLYLFICLLLLSATIYSQIPQDAVSLEDAFFDVSFTNRPMPKASGKLLNLTVEEIRTTAIKYSLVTPFAAKQLTKNTKVKPDGSFQLELDHPFPYQQIWFSVGDLFYAGLVINKDLYVELDMKKIKAAKEVNFNGAGVRYLGTDGALNVYLNNYILYKRDEQQEINKRLNELIRPRKPVEGDLLPAYNQLSEEIKKIEDSYIAENPSPYSWILENERQSEYYAEICPRYWNKVMDDSLWQKMKQHKSYLVSNSGASLYNYIAIYISSLPGDKASANWKDVAVLPDLDLEETACIDSIKTYESKRINGELLEGSYPYTSENLLKWSKKLGPRMNKILLTRSIDKTIHRLDSAFAPAKADLLKLQLNTRQDPIDQKITLERIIASMHTGWCKTVFDKEYQRTVAKIDEINNILARSTAISSVTNLGKPVMQTNFGASMYEVSDMSAREFLARLKQRFPGKAIVLDLWATWCVPCLQEMPHSKKLLEETKNLPVVFVYLCTPTSSDKNKWKSKVAELKQPGVHYFIDENLDSEIMNLFSFTGYPGYAFIDRNGNYQPGAIERISLINKEGLANLLK